MTDSSYETLPIYGTLSEADQALARSTLLKGSFNIPMPRGVGAAREADQRLRWGLEAIRKTIRPDNQRNSGLVDTDLRAALSLFEQARTGYADLGDRKGLAIANFCRAYIHFLEGNLEQADFDCKNAIDELLSVDASPHSGPK